MPNMRFKMLDKNKNMKNLNEEDFDNILDNLDKPTITDINGHKA